MRGFWVMLMLIPIFVSAQHQTNKNKYLKGTVTELTEDGQKVPLARATVYWLGTTNGTVTNDEGKFKIETEETVDDLIISYIGYKSDTVHIHDESRISVTLAPDLVLTEVEVAARRQSAAVDYIDPQYKVNIGEAELQKAACCNLSESFETTPSVDVSFTDAVTGTRQIQMLGLAGPYVQITRENIPNVRGLAAVYGLSYTPGTWVKSIQLSKGAGSVVNGYESIAGQINLELHKPVDMPRFYANMYADYGGRIEGNIHIKHTVSDRWRSATLLHASTRAIRWDRNGDGFLDNPVGNNFMALNRWKHETKSGWEMQAGVKAIYTDNTAGQFDFDKKNRGNSSSNLWGMNQITKRGEVWAKAGTVNKDLPWRSTGFQAAASVHDQQSFFGKRQYDAMQNSFYANAIYQSILSNTQHKFKAGASFQADIYDEQLDSMSFDRNEIVPGTFFEYTYDPSDRFGVVAGIRSDYHNLFGLFFTPRLHIRYAVKEDLVIRASGGRGQRTAHIMAENIGLLASSRQISVEGNSTNKPYGLDAEVAWNYGGNVTKYFTWFTREATLSLEFYQTRFENQIVVDLDRSPQQAAFYNLDGRSFSNSFQVQTDYELLENLDLRLAYRFLDVRTTYSENLRRRPLISAHRAFINLAYEAPRNWTIDYTLNWQGSKRIPDTEGNPEPYRLSHESPAFVTMNAQVAKRWSSHLETYVGVENLLNFRQTGPILAADQPFSPYFDSSLVWGPVFGRNVYVGLRYTVN